MADAKQKGDQKRIYNQSLIEFVRSHPILFNTRLDDYKNNQKKVLLWKEFGEEQFPTQDDKTVKANWNALWTNYNRAKKQVTKQPSGSGAASKPSKQWEYFESMKFLDDSMEPCEDVIGIPIEIISQNDETFTEDVSTGKTTPFVIIDPVTKTASAPFTAEILGNDVFGSDYCETFPNDSESQESLKRSCSSSFATRNLKKKKLKEVETTENEQFFAGLGSIIKQSTAIQNSQIDIKLMENLMTMVQELLSRVNKSLEEDAAALFFRSLKPLLEEFTKDKKVFAIVCNRIQNVIIESMTEFKI